MQLGHRFDDALLYASEAHRSQTRKSTAIPYLGHLLGVAGIAIDHGADEDEAIAALLHDCPEDQGGQSRLDDIRDRFGARVANIVEGCSDSLAEDRANKQRWPERKRAYLRHLAANDDASVFLVSAADKLHNVRSLLSDYAFVGENLWSRFNPDAGKTGTIRYYRSLANAYESVRDARLARIAAEIRATLIRLEDACGASSDPNLAGGADLLDDADKSAALES